MGEGQKKKKKQKLQTFQASLVERDGGNEEQKEEWSRQREDHSLDKASVVKANGNEVFHTFHKARPNH